VSSAPPVSGDPAIRRHRARRCGLVALALLPLLRTTPAIAQEQQKSQPSAVAATLRSAVRDATSYTPALVKYGAMHLDWESSQIFFRHGFMERNPRYTVSGLANDLPIDRQAGRKRIAVDSLKVLAYSVPQDLAERAIERTLIRLFPAHRKVFVLAGRIGRVATSTYLSYAVSAVHFRQWQRNEQQARRLGYK
jgi:hypothetical protein